MQCGIPELHWKRFWRVVPMMRYSTSHIIIMQRNNLENNTIVLFLLQHVPCKRKFKNMASCPPSHDRNQAHTPMTNTHTSASLRIVLSILPYCSACLRYPCM